MPRTHPPPPSLPSHPVAVAFAFMRLTNRQTKWRPAPAASANTHTHTRHFVAGSPKICLPFYRCAWQQQQQQQRWQLWLSKSAKLLCSPNCAQVTARERVAQRQRERERERTQKGLAIMRLAAQATAATATATATAAAAESGRGSSRMGEWESQRALNITVNQKDVYALSHTHTHIRYRLLSSIACSISLIACDLLPFYTKISTFCGFISGQMILTRSGTFLSRKYLSLSLCLTTVFSFFFSLIHCLFALHLTAQP